MPLALRGTRATSIRLSLHRLERDRDFPGCKERTGVQLSNVLRVSWVPEHDRVAEHRDLVPGLLFRQSLGSNLGVG